MTMKEVLHILPKQFSVISEEGVFYPSVGDSYPKPNWLGEIIKCYFLPEICFETKFTCFKFQIG